MQEAKRAAQEFQLRNSAVRRVVFRSARYTR